MVGVLPISRQTHSPRRGYRRAGDCQWRNSSSYAVVKRVSMTVRDGADDALSAVAACDDVGVALPPPAPRRHAFALPASRVHAFGLSSVTYSPTTVALLLMVLFLDDILTRRRRNLILCDIVSVTPLI